MDDKIKQLYSEYENIPFVSESRNVEQFLKEVNISKSKLVPKKNMLYVDETDKILPGHIILLWRINFGTYTNETVASKYFEYSYGIDAISELEYLIDQQYAIKHSAKQSLHLLSSTVLKNFLKNKKVTGISKMSADEVRETVFSLFTEEELSELFSIRSISLTEKGMQLLEKGQYVVDKHPKKKF